MLEDHDDSLDTLEPTDLDRHRLATLAPDGRVVSENGTWTVLCYPPKAGCDKWCQFSVCVNSKRLGARTAPYELKNLAAVFELLRGLEVERKRQPPKKS